MPDLPRVRVHATLGTAIQLKPGGPWWVALPSTGKPDTEMLESFVLKAGWRELRVSDEDGSGP